jgi:hypothetical protein
MTEVFEFVARIYFFEVVSLCHERQVKKKLVQGVVCGRQVNC